MMGVFKHVAVLDYDEFIIPFKANSLLGLVKEMEAKAQADGVSKSKLAFIFLMTLFYRHEDNKHKYQGRRGEHMLIMQLNHRTGFIGKTRRTKFIVRPEFVKEAGIHTVQLYGGSPIVVNNTDTGALFHYRYDYCICEQLIEGDHTKRYVDERMLRFKSIMENTSLYHSLYSDYPHFRFSRTNWTNQTH